jgi:predicted MFS family arabinose efflux permease
MTTPLGGAHSARDNGRSDVRMPRADLALLLAIVAATALIFLPITHDVELAGVSLIAWELWALMMAAPAAGLVLAWREED